MKYAMVLSMAIIFSMVAIPNHSSGKESRSQVTQPVRPPVGYNQQGTRSGWVPEAVEWATDDAPAYTLDPRRDDARRESLRRAYTGTLARSARGQERLFAQAKGMDIKGDTVDFTPPRIKEQGHELKNYCVMLSATWCRSCKIMYPMVEELRKADYIIYVFDIDVREFKNYEALYDVKAFPTFIIFDGGKEVNRVVGRVKKDWFTENLKTEKEQEKPAVPDDDPYSGL